MKNGTEIKSVRLPKDLIKKVEDKAKSENRNFSNMVHTILNRAIAG